MSGMDLTPYVSPVRTMSGYITPQTLRYGYNAARAASPYAARAATAIGRVYRGYSARKKRKYPRPEKVGHPVGKDTAKTKAQTTIDVVKEPSRTQIATDITAISKVGGGFLDIDKRMRQIVHLRGYAWNIQVVNNSTDTPVTLNIAIVSMKKSDTLNISFRDYNASRDKNFTTGLTNQQMHNLPISTDRLNVYMHKRYVLGRKWQADSKFNPPHAANYKNIKGYLKINRQIRYDDDGTTLCETPIYFVHWVDKYMAPSLSPITNDIIDWCNRGVTYFSESKSSY